MTSSATAAVPPQTAYDDFEVVAAANLLDGKHCKVSDCILGYALYIDPQLGRVGLTAGTRQRDPRPQATDERVESGDRIRTSGSCRAIAAAQIARVAFCRTPLERPALHDLRAEPNRRSGDVRKML